MIDPRQLQQYMDFYKQAMPMRDRSHTFDPYGGGDGGQEADNYLGAALSFAQRMAGGNAGGNGTGGRPGPAPDFFGADAAPQQQGAYHAPQRFTLDQPPAPLYGTGPLQGRNVLASVLKRYG